MPDHKTQENFYDRFYPKRRWRLLGWLRSDRPRLNFILLVATYLSTFVTAWFPNKDWQAGLWYSTAIISILLAHEMGHYLMCRKYGIRATLPFFLPLPFTLFGTLGAVIKMEAPIPNRKALFDVAVAGPLAGLAFAVPAIYFGLQLSTIIEADGSGGGTISLAEPILYDFLSNLAIGPLPEGKDVLLHPLAFAGWAGLFVTALNLLPIGQLDGGHVIYALLGRHHRFVAISSLVIFGGITIFMFKPWIVMFLLLVFFGYRHPPTLDETPIDHKRVALGIITLLIFALSFSPRPFEIP